ncbi:uncharacterized protein LOC125529828 [Triticum urartu]|uniref:uncharacterized protein LOC125529828 n=1 Tax=Triticum urartu TaxID=4572 RepID=UPI0020444198|nr:uncharacterized protein LOC125529828 [Triticum urartu]
MEVHTYTTSQNNWHELRAKAWRQAVRIATRFENIPLSLAYYGFREYTTSKYLAFVKDLDSVFFEIWKLVNRQQMSFRDAMEHVYEESPFPLSKRDLEHELSHPVSLGLEEKVIYLLRCKLLWYLSL